MKSILFILAVLAICVFLVNTFPRVSRLQTLILTPAVARVSFESPQPELLASSATNVESSIPQAGASAPVAMPETTYAAVFPGLSEFAAQVTGEETVRLSGVYVPGQFALPVQQQPAGRSEYVTEKNELLTQFAMPARYGSTGILAHNYLSGSLFSGLSESQDIVLVFSDGRMEQYQVTRIERFQALSPDSPFSQFVDLADPDQAVLTSSELFSRIYTTPGQLVFQTCIQEGSEPSWGRLFVIAAPVALIQSAMPSVGEFISDN